MPDKFEHKLYQSDSPEMHQQMERETQVGLAEFVASNKTSLLSRGQEIARAGIHAIDDLKERLLPHEHETASRQVEELRGQAQEVVASASEELDLLTQQMDGPDPEYTPAQPDATKESLPEVPDIKDRPRGLDSLYSVYKDGDSFVLVLPGLLSMDGEFTMGTHDKRIATLDEALQTAETAKDETKVRMELMALQHSFDSFAYIKQEEAGGFRVAVPGTLMIQGDERIVCGSTYINFPTWNEAKDYYLEHHEIEKLSDRPLLSVDLEADSKVVFTGAEAFDPKVNLAGTSLPVPSEIQDTLLKDDGTGLHTYERTIEKDHWEIELFDFVISYLSHDGAPILENLGVKPEDLKRLTPKQAVEISTRLVIALSKYKKSDAQVESTIENRQTGSTEADQSDALTFLREGRRNKDDPNWEGNGVCRNYACAVKAVFEAIKAQQKSFNYLRNTYCTYSGGLDYMPKKEHYGPNGGKPPVSHAWNTFVTVTRDRQAETTIADATWAKQNLETGEIDGLDYTMTRAEPLIYKTVTAKNFDPTPEELECLINFYGMRLEHAGSQTGGHTQVAEEKTYLRHHLLGIVDHNQGYDILAGQENLSGLIAESFEAAISDSENFDSSEVAKFWQLLKACQRSEVQDSIISKTTGAMSQIIRNYLAAQPSLSEYNVGSFIVNDTELQQRFYHGLLHRQGFQKFVNESPTFRTRVRETMPNALPPFDPDNRPEDRKELEYLFGYAFGVRASSMSNLSNSDMLERPRRELGVIDPEGLDTQAASLSDYDLLKQFQVIKQRIRFPRKAD